MPTTRNTAHGASWRASAARAAQLASEQHDAPTPRSSSVRETRFSVLNGGGSASSAPTRASGKDKGASGKNVSAAREGGLAATGGAAVAAFGSAATAATVPSKRGREDMRRVRKQERAERRRARREERPRTLADFARMHDERAEERKSHPLPARIARRIGQGAAVLLVFVLFVCAFLYPVAKPYYVAMRDGQRTEAQLAAVEERNEALAEENASLKTDEGIEAQARNDFGFVMKGEESAIVTGVEGQSSLTSVPDPVDTDAITAPSTWYYDLLDALFAYDNGTEDD